MSHFEQLNPAVQHHIVNSLGWRELRPFQDAVIPHILAGTHLVILAPTAGGKTEAAFFPVLSRMLTEGWRGLSVLYVCPIKALLNNLDIRLQRYCRLVGRRSALWHGDVKTSERKRIMADPPDCLLTTPESIEVMLVSSAVDEKRLLGTVQAVIVDEIHAFAGDDRGWHLQAVLERVTRLAGHELQRIGLSATVGNPQALADWLAGHCEGPRSVYLPGAESSGVEANPGSQGAPESQGIAASSKGQGIAASSKGPGIEAGPGTQRSRQSSADADVKLDFVGNLSNAAVVISRLYRGEKRLVFVDSRSRAEQLATELRQVEITTFVSHSSLSPEQRRQAEEAFASRQDCVIVATSALELGIDVGDLDRVIQIDAPPTVSSFLQRMGRTGRRANRPRNCLFLATTEGALIQAAGLIRLWQSGYVEPAEPPPMPLHIFAQQLMALALQEGGIALDAVKHWLGRMPAFASLDRQVICDIVDHMIRRDILWNDNGTLWFGRAGEKRYGRRHFMELLSVFTSPPLFDVFHGRAEIGMVHQLSLMPTAGTAAPDDAPGPSDQAEYSHSCGPVVISLAGRSWKVTHIDWPKHRVYVEPATEKGHSRWIGAAQPLRFELCEAIRDVLADDQQDEFWSTRAREEMARIREEFSWLDPQKTTVVSTAGDHHTWWTFAGRLANATFAGALHQELGLDAEVNDLAIEWSRAFPPGEMEHRLVDCLAVIRSSKDMVPPVADEVVDELKFSECLPRSLAILSLQHRLADKRAVLQTAGEVRFLRA